MQKWIYFLLIVLSFILYGNGINNDYAIDDDYVVGGEFVQQGIAGIPAILTHRYGAQAKSSGLDYRPVVLISYALEHQFFHQSPHISHFINILLYAVCLIVLYNILISVFSLHKIHALLPVVITVFYAIHPLHTEVVDSLKNRDELFGLLFGMLFLKYGYSYFTLTENRLKNALLTLLFLVLTLLSKIVGIVYLPIFILILFYYGLLRWNKWNYIIIACCFIILGSVTGIILSGLKRETYSFENSLIGVKDFMVVFPTMLKTIFYHIQMLIYPNPLRFYYGHNMFPLKSTFEPTVIFSFIVHVVLLATGIINFRKRKVIGLFILCYLGSMFLYSNFPIPYTGMFSERALFLSSIWFIALTAILAFRLVDKLSDNFSKYSVIALSFLVFIFYSYKTIQRNFYWKNSLILMTHDIPFLENSVTANYLYAKLLNKESTNTTDSIYAKKLALAAVKHYKQTINLYPYYPEFFYQLAGIYRYQLNDIGKAEKQFKNILLIDSNYSGANFELAKIYFERKEFKTSYPYFKKAYLSNPSDSLTLFYLAQNSLSVGDMNTCYKVNKEFLKLFPDIVYPYLNLGVYYSTILKDDTAVIYFSKAIELGNRSPDLLKNMAIYYHKKNDEIKSDYYKKLYLSQ